MAATKDEMISLLQASGALRFGNFVLKSGDRSPFFVNLGEVKTGDALTCLGRAFDAAIHTAFPDASLLFGPAYKGIALATATAMAGVERGANLGVCFDRKEAKGHGEGGGFIGQPPRPEDRVVVVDDVISNGATKRQAITALNAQFGASVAGIVVAVNRVRRKDLVTLEGLPLVSLLDLTDLVAWLDAKGSPHASAVRQFYEEA